MAGYFWGSTTLGVHGHLGIAHNSVPVSLQTVLARGLAVCRLTGTLVLSGLCPQVPMLLGDLIELEAVGR